MCDQCLATVAVRGLEWQGNAGMLEWQCSLGLPAALPAVLALQTTSRVWTTLLRVDTKKNCTNWVGYKILTSAGDKDCQKWSGKIGRRLNVLIFTTFSSNHLASTLVSH